MSAPILVTGGTGTLGRHLVPALVAAGREVRVLSRRPQPPMEHVTFVVGDLEKGVGVDAAVDGAETVIHGAGSAQRDGLKARNLVAALERSGAARHLVYVSVVGADTTPFASSIDRSTLGYFEQKRLGELAVEGASMPFTTLRATQFHDFFAAYAQLGLKLPVMPSFAGFRYQPVDARDVAERLIEVALGEPAGYVSPIGGPRIYAMEDLLRSYLLANGRRRLVLPLRIPGIAARAQRAGANLAPDHASGRRMWEDYLSCGTPTP